MRGSSGSAEKAWAANAGQLWRGVLNIPKRLEYSGFPQSTGEGSGSQSGRQAGPARDSRHESRLLQGCTNQIPRRTIPPASAPCTALTNESKFAGSLPSSDTNSLHSLPYVPLLSQRGGHDPLTAKGSSKCQAALLPGLAHKERGHLRPAGSLLPSRANWSPMCPGDNGTSSPATLAAEHLCLSHLPSLIEDMQTPFPLTSANSALDLAHFASFLPPPFPPPAV